MSETQNGGVVITLENPLLSEEVLSNTPSMKDGLDPETETGLRWHGCKLIQYSCLLLKLPAGTLVTAQVLFQRYFYSKSFVRCKLDVASLACIWLASKVEESPRRLRNITNVLLRLRQIRRKEKTKPILVDDEYYQTKKELINMERKILKDLGYCVHVNHPYKYLFYISNWLKQNHNKELLQGAWNYMNDSLMTNLYVRYHPKVIVCACLHLSARILGVALPEPAWHEVFGVAVDELEKICFTILELYASEPANLDVLEGRCGILRKIIDEKRAEEKKALAEKYKHLKVDSPSLRTLSPAVGLGNTSKTSTPEPSKLSQSIGSVAIAVPLPQVITHSLTTSISPAPLSQTEDSQATQSVSPPDDGYDDGEGSRKRYSEDRDRYYHDRKHYKYDDDYNRDSRRRRRDDDDRHESRRYRDENSHSRRRHSRSRSPRERRNRDKESRRDRDRGDRYDDRKHSSKSSSRRDYDESRSRDRREKSKHSTDNDHYERSSGRSRRDRSQ